jgi:hypothetical protein
MATAKQSKAITKVLENMGKKQPIKMHEIMIDAGYSPSMAKNPQVLTTSKAWLETMKEIDFGLQLKQVEELGDIRLNTDKDNALKAKDMLFKLGDKYPKGETKIIGIFNKIDAISDPDPK